MADLNGAAVKVLLVILRHTQGAGEETTILDYDQLLAAT